jgi:hypothetical protein
MILIAISFNQTQAEKPYRNGTTTAISWKSASAVTVRHGEASVSMVGNLSSITGIRRTRVSKTERGNVYVSALAD